MSKTSIINKALSLLGANRIVNISDETLEAQCASNIYDDSLRSILSECGWKFALDNKLLNRVDKQPEWVKNGMKYYFQLPSDMVIITNISSPHAKWEIQGEYLLTSESTIGIEYVKFIDDTSKYPAYFIDAFACKLASDMCYEITNSNEKTMSLLDLYKGEFLPLAKSKNARNGSSNTPYDENWVASTIGGFYG